MKTFLFLMTLVLLLLPAAADAQIGKAPPCCSIGDLNGDQWINGSDMLIILGTSTLTAEQEFNADVNGDGVVDRTGNSGSDASLIQSYLLSSQADASFGKCGDIEGGFFGGPDKRLNSDDLDAITAFIITPTVNPLTALQQSNVDANCSGTVTTFDKIKIQKVINGLSQGFPACTYQGC